MYTIKGIAKLFETRNWITMINLNISDEYAVVVRNGQKIYKYNKLYASNGIKTVDLKLVLKYQNNIIII